MKYHVKYYDSKLSKKGKGTQIAAFKTRAEAEDFAGRNQIYSMPCRVELVAEPEDEAKLLALASLTQVRFDPDNPNEPPVPSMLAAIFYAAYMNTPCGIAIDAWRGTDPSVPVGTIRVQLITHANP
jgi:hypothetical protein